MADDVLYRKLRAQLLTHEATIVELRGEVERLGTARIALQNTYNHVYDDNARLREVLEQLAIELEAESVVDTRTGTHRGRMYEKHIAGGKARIAIRLRDALARLDAASPRAESPEEG